MRVSLNWRFPIRILLASRDRVSSTLKTEAANYSDTWTPFYQTTRLHNPEDCKLHIHCRDNLNSHTMSWLGKHVLKCNIFTWIALLSSAC
jgi:hypothetical protein